MLEWKEPPRRIVFHSESTSPDIDGGDPGPDIQELTEIGDWFSGRGIVVVYLPRGLGTPGGDLVTTRHSAILVDPDSDVLVARFEAESRLAAARAARQWWIENRGPGKPVEIELAPAHGQSNATLELEVPKISPEQQEKLDRREITSAPPAATG